MASYPLLSLTPTPVEVEVEVELGCDNLGKVFVLTVKLIIPKYMCDVQDGQSIHLRRDQDEKEPYITI